MVFSCGYDPRNKNLTDFVVYDKDLRLAFKNAASAAKARQRDLRTPQFSQTRRVIFARSGATIVELDPWNRKSKVFVDFGGTEFKLRDGTTVRAGGARDFKVGPGDAIVIELGVPRRVLQPGVRDCPDCFEILGVATFDPGSGRKSSYTVRDDDRVARWPKVGTRGFDEVNLTQDSPARVFFNYQNRPSWSFALDFSDAVEFRQPSFGEYGSPKYQWSAHGHPGFFCGSNERCYVVRPLNDIIDDDRDGMPDRVGQVGVSPQGRWRGLYVLTDSKSGKVELVWGAQIPEQKFGFGHFSRSLKKNVFFGSGAKHEGNTITRYEVSFDQYGKPTAVRGQNVAYTNSEIKCGYWAHPRATSSDDGTMALFDSTLAGGCRSQVYVVSQNLTTSGQ